MYIANLCLFYQHTAKNAKKSEWLSPDESNYSNEWKVTKSEIDTFFFLVTLDFIFLSSAVVNLCGLLSA